ncbi:MAG: MarR family transcriptional regulator [Pseudomonadota bacterium]
MAETATLIETSQSDRVLISIRQIIRAVDIHSKRLVRETGLSAPQLVVLRSIDELGEVTTRVLSLHVSLSQPTVTTILDRLETKGLVERYRSRKDRRVVHTKLTRDGKKTLRTSPPLLQEAFTDTFDALPEGRRQDIVSAVSDLAQMMRADDIDASPVLTTAATART